MKPLPDEPMTTDAQASHPSAANNPSFLRSWWFWCGTVATLLLAVSLNRHEIIDQWLLRVEFPVPSTTNGSIVISGTSSGIGRATCTYLAERYISIIFYCGIRNPATATDYPFTLPNVRALSLDVTDPEQVTAAISSVESPLLAVISNAGMGNVGTLEFQSMATIERIFQVNVFGSIRLIQAALPSLRQTSGRIVSISSVSALVTGFPRSGAYQGSKAAIEKMTDSMRQELFSHNISISLVEPGFVETALIERLSKMGEDLMQTAGISKAEEDMYPDLYNPKFLQLQSALMRYGGKMEESCQAIEHALFSPSPRTRYTTSRMGVLPAHLFATIVNLFPTDRFSDWFFLNLGLQQLAVHMQEVQSAIETQGLLGFLWGGGTSQ